MSSVSHLRLLFYFGNNVHYVSEIKEGMPNAFVVFHKRITIILNKDQSFAEKLDVVGKVKRHLLVLPRVLEYPTLLLELLVTFLLDVLELLLERLGLRLLQLPDSLEFFREPPCSIDCELLARLDALVEDNEQTLHQTS